jgi:hypothetical protein
MSDLEIPEAVQAEYDRILDRWDMTGEVPTRLKAVRVGADGTATEVWCHLDEITPEFAALAFASHRAKAVRHLAHYAAAPSRELARHIAEHLALADLARSQLPEGAAE